MEVLSRSNVPPGEPIYNSSGAVGLDQVPRSMFSVGATFAWFTFVPNAITNIIVNDRGYIVWDDPFAYKHKFMLPVFSQSDSDDSTKVVIWRNDGKMRYEDEQGTLRERAWPQPYDRGYTNAVFFAVLTNLEGLRVPISATLTSYVPDAGGTSKEARIYKKDIYVLEATRIMAGSTITEFRPHLPPHTYVMDNRLIAKDARFHPSAFVTNGGDWNVASAAKLLRDYSSFEMASRRAIASRVGHEGIRRGAPIAMLLLVSISAVFLAVRLSSKTTKQ
jgi:hypothetical protein